jgi:hypothetical protein
LESAVNCRRSKFQAVAFAFHLIAPIALCLSGASSAQAAAGCDAGKWPLSAIQAHFGGTLPALASGDALPALGAPVLVNLSAQGDVTFPHAPGRAGKANPAYAAVIKLGAEPAATYQVTVSDGAWVDMVEDGELVKQSGYVRRKDCPGVDKSIRFKTDGGPLTIQISGAYGKTIKVEAARAE